MLCGTLTAQRTPVIFTIPADSTRLTGCDSNELIIENHTQSVHGFLFNTGRGRTEFRRGLVSLGDGSYQIGADTLNAWIQGGNRPGATGVLGTNDNNHLDLYTNGLQRARLTKDGNFLIGKTTDDGNLLQLNGGITIGSASISSAGILKGTNALLFDHFIPRFHNFDYQSPYISQLNDVLYNYATRLNTTTSGDSLIDITFPPDECPYAITYPQGSLYFSFWSNQAPQTISVTTKDIHGNWFGPFTTSIENNLNPGGAGLYQVPISLPGNYLTELKIVFTHQTGIGITLYDLAYILAVPDGLTNPNPYVSKYGDEHIYNNFFLKNGGVDNVRLSPNLADPNYFLNRIGIGTTSPTAQLHTTGTVRFEGLSSDNTQTRVLVGDANGNLYYRDASTLAANEPVRSSLAVNGPIKARELMLTARNWPDYVFDSSYSLPALAGLEEYIRQHHHLPGLPAAGDVEQVGANVGATQEALLKKIEELTLYILKQDKEMKAMKEKMDLILAKLNEQ